MAKYESENPQTNVSIKEFYQRFGYKYKNWLSEFNKYEEVIPTIIDGEGETIPNSIQGNHAINTWDFKRKATLLFMREILEQWEYTESESYGYTGRPNLVSYEWTGEWPKYWNRVYEPTTFVKTYYDYNIAKYIYFALENLPERYNFYLDNPANILENTDWAEIPAAIQFYETTSWERRYNVPPMEKYLKWMRGSFYGQIDPPKGYEYWNCIDPAIRMRQIKRKRTYNAESQLISDEILSPSWLVGVEGDIDELIAGEIERVDRVYRGALTSYGAVRYLGTSESVNRYDKWYFFEGQHFPGGIEPYQEYKGYTLINDYRGYWLTETLTENYLGAITDKYINVYMDIDVVASAE